MCVKQAGMPLHKYRDKVDTSDRAYFSEPKYYASEKQQQNMALDKGQAEDLRRHVSTVLRDVNILLRSKFPNKFTEKSAFFNSYVKHVVSQTRAAVGSTDGARSK